MPTKIEAALEAQIKFMREQLTAMIDADMGWEPAHYQEVARVARDVGQRIYNQRIYGRDEAPVDGREHSGAPEGGGDE